MSKFNALPAPGVEIHPAMPAAMRETHEDDEPSLQIDAPASERGIGGSFKCWCGAEGKYSELCDRSGLEKECGGSGSLSCYCGGDLCVCHHHGEVDCAGCSDCRDVDGYDEGDAAPPDLSEEL